MPFLSGVLQGLQKKKNRISLHVEGEPWWKCDSQKKRPSSHHGFGDSQIRSFCLVNHVDTQGLSHKELGVYTCGVLNWNTGTQGTSQDLAER